VRPPTHRSFVQPLKPVVRPIFRPAACSLLPVRSPPSPTLLTRAACHRALRPARLHRSLPQPRNLGRLLHLRFGSPEAAGVRIHPLPRRIYASLAGSASTQCSSVWATWSRPPLSGGAGAASIPSSAAPSLGAARSVWRPAVPSHRHGILPYRAAAWSRGATARRSSHHPRLLQLLQAHVPGPSLMPNARAEKIEPSDTGPSPMSDAHAEK